MAQILPENIVLIKTLQSSNVKTIIISNIKKGKAKSPQSKNLKNDIIILDIFQWKKLLKRLKTSKKTILIKFIIKKVTYNIYVTDYIIKYNFCNY